jgi:parvulin-like peptidyl-prolyl isomerase
LSRPSRSLFGRISDAWSNQDEDSRGTLLLVAGIGALVALALIVIAYGYYVDRIAPENDAVMKVGDRTFTYSDLERRVKADLATVGTITQEQFGGLVSQTLSDLERGELFRQLAKERQMTVTDEEIEAQIRDDLEVAETAGRDVYALSLRDHLIAEDIGLDDYKLESKTKLIEARIRQELESAVPAEAEQINIRLLQTNNQSDAAAAKQRLDNGEDFAVLAATVSVHSSRSKAGEVGWVIRDSLPSKLEEAAFVLEAGQRTDIVETEQGFFIAEVRAKEVRAVEDGTKAAAVAHRLSDALTETRDRVGSEILITTGQISRLLRSVQSVSARGG